MIHNMLHGLEIEGVPPSLKKQCNFKAIGQSQLGFSIFQHNLVASQLVMTLVNKNQDKTSMNPGYINLSH